MSRSMVDRLMGLVDELQKQVMIMMLIIGCGRMDGWVGQCISARTRKTNVSFCCIVAS
jgi:hypothetical protein